MWGTGDTYKCTKLTMGTWGAECKHKCPIRTVTTFWTSECGTALLPVSSATWCTHLLYQTVASPRLCEVEVEPAMTGHEPRMLPYNVTLDNLCATCTYVSHTKTPPCFEAGWGDNQVMGPLDPNIHKSIPQSPSPHPGIATIKG